MDVVVREDTAFVVVDERRSCPTLEVGFRGGDRPRWDISSLVQRWKPHVESIRTSVPSLSMDPSAQNSVNYNEDLRKVCALMLPRRPHALN